MMENSPNHYCKIFSCALHKKKNVSWGLGLNDVVFGLIDSQDVGSPGVSHFGVLELIRCVKASSVQQVFMCEKIV